MYTTPLARSIADLFWTFFPVFIVVLVLALLGKVGHLVERTDLVLCAALLFAEGWSRSKSVYHAMRGVFGFCGFIGALITVVLASLMLLVEVGQITQLTTVTTSSRFTTLHYLMLALSVIYGLLVRLAFYSRVGFDPGGTTVRPIL